jgi:hypothetical protein
MLVVQVFFVSSLEAIIDADFLMRSIAELPER